MITPYKDKTREVSKYRAVIMFRTVGIVMLITIIVAAVFTQINLLVMDAVLLCLILVALIYHINIDRTIIHSGQFLVDDGIALYVLSGTFNFGFGRRHHQNKYIKSYRFYCINEVKKIKEYSFGVAIRAKVLTGTSEQIGADREMLETPGAVKAGLEAKGKERTLLFRLERNLTSKDEERLLRRLKHLSK